MKICITKEAIEKYQINPSLLTSNGFLLIDDFQTSRIVASKINEREKMEPVKINQLKAYQIRALGQLVSIYRSIFVKHINVYPGLITEWINSLNLQFTKHTVDKWFSIIKTAYPCLNNSSDRNALKEIFLIWIVMQNPALSFSNYFFMDDLLLNNSYFQKIFQNLCKFFMQSNYPFNSSINFVDFILKPINEFPKSLIKQIEFIRNNWWDYLDNSRTFILPTLKFIHEEILEEEKRAHSPERVLTFKDEHLAAKFSREKPWMHELILMTKNTYVWLDQLSKTYNKSIQELDQIPDEELEILQERGITGLWLIGIWERSKASKHIKELYGNSDAIASAYSVYAYEIAEDLGGEKSYQNLKNRAMAHNIRLGSDMVPNHTGIDSPWVIEHPEWFISSNTNPVKEFNYNSPNLSPSPKASIKLEQHYYDRSGAAEVFQYIDFKGKHTRYIYHGNDGTSMPWNDTAQLNYLKPEVREAVKRIILDVAKKSSIIRFDAAMTLTKKHYKRLWFPLPGATNCVPTREKFTMSQKQFDKLMPREFWREVVELISMEAPDTLLIAEAFWLMEGYFVRELGMHRVYNSAFMNLLRDEENAKYRQLLKNTLSYDHRILGRFVNFMNNPDERTAIDLFGKGNKYFGVCTMMVTMPGLPLFGHGQIEGYSERYGMDFNKAKWNEDIDQELVQRHQKEIFPLLHKRGDFIGTDNFKLYDFKKEDDTIDENVFAYSNKNNNKTYLVIYNNSYQATKGSINKPFENAASDSHSLKTNIFDLLSNSSLLSREQNFLVLSDLKTKKDLSYSRDEITANGLCFSLKPYEVHVFQIKKPE